MAAVFRGFKAAQIATIGNLKLPSFICRSFASSPILQYDRKWQEWLQKSDPTKEPHSRMLSDKGVIYTLHTHNIRPDSVDNYLTNYICKRPPLQYIEKCLEINIPDNSQEILRYYSEETVKLLNSKSNLQLELVGSWTVTAGDIDQALHLWRYNDGYGSVDRAQIELSKDKEYQQLFKDCGKYVRSRYLQYLLAFSYWPNPTKRDDSNIYEIRSYRLNAGGMIEWGNNWAKAINFRRHNNEPFGGFFSQIGRLYNVHHIWCYKSLQARMETRESAWRSPGWDRCVAHTVPIIRETHSRILSPTNFSPTK